jgi:hypothetical protein
MKITTKAELLEALDQYIELLQQLNLQLDECGGLVTQQEGPKS